MHHFLSFCLSLNQNSDWIVIKVIDDIGVIMTPFGDIVTVILVLFTYLSFYDILQSSQGKWQELIF